MTAETIVRQILQGHELPQTPVRCSQCHCPLRDGARLWAVARRVDDAGHWHVAATYCREHAPDTVPETPFGPSALVRGDVGALVNTGRQTHSACLLSVEIVDHALDTESAVSPDDIREARERAEQCMANLVDGDPRHYLEINLQHVHARLGGEYDDLYPDSADGCDGIIEASENGGVAR